MMCAKHLRLVKLVMAKCDQKETEMTVATNLRNENTVQVALKSIYDIEKTRQETERREQDKLAEQERLRRKREEKLRNEESERLAKKRESENELILEDTKRRERELKIRLEAEIRCYHGWTKIKHHSCSNTTQSTQSWR